MKKFFDKPGSMLILAMVVNALMVPFQLSFHHWYSVIFAFLNAMAAWYCWLVYRRIKKVRKI